jgi:hypothetical protein
MAKKGGQKRQEKAANRNTNKLANISRSGVRAYAEHNYSVNKSGQLTNSYPCHQTDDSPIWLLLANDPIALDQLPHEAF